MNLGMLTVCGAGALGSHLVQILRSEKLLPIRVVDFDRVESHNLGSQFHGAQGRGKLKVQALQQTMQFLWGAKLVATPTRLTADNVDAVLGGSELVVDCLDNAKGRRLVQQFCEQAAIPCLHGALAAGGTYGRVVWSEHFVVDEEKVAGGHTCEDGAFLPFIALVSAYLARSVQLFVKDGRRVGFEVTPTGPFAT